MKEELDVLFKPVVRLYGSTLESVEKLRTELQKKIIQYLEEKYDRAHACKLNHACPFR